MKIVVCIKQVPNTNVEMDKDTGNLIRNTKQICMNMYDYLALEAALQIKDKKDVEVVAITMGPESAKQVLIEAYELGVDKCILLCDKKFSGSDVLSTSYVLSKAIQKLFPYDLVICGKQTTDGDTAQVSGAISSRLNISYVPWVDEIIDFDKNNCKVRCSMEPYKREILLKYPSVLSINPSIYKPRIPSFSNKLKAKKKEIEVFNAEKLNVDYEKIGMLGSATKVIKVEQINIKEKKEIQTMPEKNLIKLITDICKGGN